MNHRDIAAMANVSVSTVSKALSGSREISEELSAEIKKIALECGYFAEKSRRKREYSKNKDTRISVLVPEIVSVHYSSIVTSVKDYAEERGAMVSVYIFDFSKEKLEKIVRELMLSRDTDGIVMVSASVLSFVPTVPVVSFGSLHMEACYDTVGYDCYEMMCTGLDYLMSLGHRDIGFVGESLTLSKQIDFLRAADAKGPSVDCRHVYNIDERFEKIGSEAARLMLSRSEHPTAVIAAYDEVAIALINTLQAGGVRVPEDISVLGINDIPSAAFSSVPLTTFRLFFSEQAALAIDLLYDKIFGVSTTVTHLPVSPELIVRDSCCEIPKSEKQSKIEK